MARSSSDLMKADLARSGIDLKYAKKLGLQLLTSDETSEFMKADFGVPSYEIPYFNSSGKSLGYSRLKNLQPTARFGKAKKKQTFKYLQKSNTAPHLYIPPVYRWPKTATGLIKVDRLVITEGEKKAIKACLCGIACVALGGVDSFKASKRGIFLLEEFDEFDLTETAIEICYDSDFNANEGVRKAMHQLSASLAQKEPLSTTYVMLDAESTGHGKQGLDDFLVSQAHPLKAFDNLPRKTDQRQDRITLLNQELCYLKSAGKLYNIHDDRYYESGAALLIDYGPKYKVPDPEDPRRQVPAAKLWLEDRSPDTWCEDLVYEPGKPQRYRDGRKKFDSINLWRASDVRPVKGNVDLWLDLVHFVMGDQFNFEWFMQWLAYPLQKPGSKLLQGVFVYSKANGVGKNFVIEPLIRKIYGPSYRMIKATDLESDFNSWAKNRQFIFGDEIYMSDRRDRDAAMGNLKSIITNEYITINAKFRPEETFKNYAHLYLTANQANALALDSADRRVFVVHAPEEPKEPEYYKTLHDWCSEDSSASHLLWFLQNKVNISAFNPKASAPMTNDKRDVLISGRSMVEFYISILEDEPLKIFSINGVRSEQELLTSTEIYSALNTYGRAHNLSPIGMSPDALGRLLGVSKILKKRRIQYRSGDRVIGPVSIYSVFNHNHWAKKDDEDWKRHYKKTHPDLIEKKLSVETGKVVNIEEARSKK